MTFWMNDDELARFLEQLNSSNLPTARYPFVMVDGKPQLLGAGGFGAVFLCRTPLGIDGAIKVIGLQSQITDPEQLKPFNAEIKAQIKAQIQALASCCNIVKLEDALILVVRQTGSAPRTLKIERHIEYRDFAETKRAEEPYVCYFYLIRMEKLVPVVRSFDAWDMKLHDRLAALSEEEILKFALDIAQALRASHQAGILHRDVKLQNTFWDPFQQVYKLGDFGVARIVDDGKASTYTGTKAYMAPEVENGDRYDKTADIYSFGVMIYQLLNGTHLPPMRMKREGFPPPLAGSAEFQNIVLKACSYRPENRQQSMDEMIDCLRAVQLHRVPSFTKSVVSTYQEETLPDDLLISVGAKSNREALRSITVASPAPVPAKEKKPPEPKPAEAKKPIQRVSTSEPKSAQPEVLAQRTSASEPKSAQPEVLTRKTSALAPKPAQPEVLTQRTSALAPKPAQPEIQEKDASESNSQSPTYFTKTDYSKIYCSVLDDSPVAAIFLTVMATYFSVVFCLSFRNWLLPGPHLWQNYVLLALAAIYCIPCFVFYPGRRLRWFLAVTDCAGTVFSLITIFTCKPLPMYIIFFLIHLINMIWDIATVFSSEEELSTGFLRLWLFCSTLMLMLASTFGPLRQWLTLPLTPIQVVFLFAAPGWLERSDHKGLICAAGIALIAAGAAVFLLPGYGIPVPNFLPGMDLIIWGLLVLGCTLLPSLAVPGVLLLVIGLAAAPVLNYFGIAPAVLGISLSGPISQTCVQLGIYLICCEILSEITVNL